MAGGAMRGRRIGPLLYPGCGMTAKNRGRVRGLGDLTEEVDAGVDQEDALFP